MTTAVRTTLDTPLGRYVLAASARGLRGVGPVTAKPRSGCVAAEPEVEGAARVLALAREAFARYFAGELDALACLPLDPDGTPFQRRVWRALREIPPGATESYGALARRIGRPGAARAVGRAGGANPIAVAVPCHRMIGGDGALTGYAGGLARKRWLLDHERAREGRARP